MIGSHGKNYCFNGNSSRCFSPECRAVGVEKLILNFGLRLSVGCKILHSSPLPVVKYFACGLVIYLV